MNKICRNCGNSEVNGAEFYKRTGNICKPCFNRYRSNQQKQNRIKAVAYKGGECQLCGYNKCMDALCFHHLDPENKDTAFKYMRSWSWDRIVAEIDTCMLVCANCHAELHANEQTI